MIAGDHPIAACIVVAVLSGLFVGGVIYGSVRAYLAGRGARRAWRLDRMTFFCKGCARMVRAADMIAVRRVGERAVRAFRCRDCMSQGRT